MFMCRFILFVILSVLIPPATSSSQVPPGSTQTSLAVLLSSDRTSGKISDSIVLTIMVKNVSSAPIFLYGKLDWGPSSSLFLFVEDEKGKNVPMGFFEDALPPLPSKKDKTLFIKLNPDHFFGTTRVDKLSELVPKPGIYYFQIYYHGPVPKSFAAGSPAWGTEDPPILSNRLKIEVQ